MTTDTASPETPAETHHARIVREVRERIVSGEWPPGSRIPFEEDMAETYGVSRMTVNKALGQLTREGYLERKRRTGTVVRMPAMKSAVLEIVDIEREITALGRAYSYRLISREIRRPTAGEAEALGLGRSDTDILALTCVHGADGAPFCAEERIINLAAVPAAPNESFTNTSPGGWLLRQVPWSGAKHVIGAVGARAAVAKLLAIPPGTPCLEVIRSTSLDGVHITQARLTYPGSQHQLVAEFTP